MTLPATYDWRLVVLSVLVSMLGAFAAHRFSDRIAAAHTLAWPWILGGGLASGVSTWAMHYVGMAALRLPVQVFYYWPIVAVSYSPAAFTTMLALILVGRRSIGWVAALGGSVLIGGGIAALHYSAMEAMQYRGMHHYSPAVVLLSIVLAMVVVLAPLKLTFLDRREGKRSAARQLASIVLWGAANPLMHYTAMAGTTFTVSGQSPVISHVVTIGALGGVGFAVAAMTAAAAGLVTAFVDRLRAQGAVFAERLIAVQEGERARLARELHDEIGQELTAIRLNLGRIEQAPERTAAILRDTRAIIDRTLQEIRDISTELRPLLLDDVGLAAALRSYAQREGARAGIDVEVTADLQEGRLPEALETACFRIVQEALNNAVRHSGARHVRVKLERRGAEVLLTLADDGRGFDPGGERSLGGLGLLGMRERAILAGGSLEIVTAPGKGTLVQARFPLVK